MKRSLPLENVPDDGPTVPPPPAAPGLLSRLAHERAQLPQAQQKVVDLLLADPRRFVNEGVEQLSAWAGVSMPSFMRTARRMGFEGLRDFRLALAQDLARPTAVHRTVGLSDTPTDVVSKIVQGAAASISDLHQQLDVAVLNQAAERIALAHRIDCYSAGATSGFMAQDLEHRLFRLGRPAHAVADAHQQLISAATLGAGGVAVAISHVGRMPFLLESVAFARSGGATVIAITQPNTPLAECADIVLGVTVPPDAVMRVGTEAYLAHLIVVEILCLLVLQNLGQAGVQHLARFRNMLHARGQDAESHPATTWNWSAAERDT
ncbi:MurR/RpiR family transcriptional regulator [Limnohabitans sp.]|jgi:RpiR family carbohydrate utilization transcriptional regulator|uniref:MurR/RpiR family transcriptional regulator n=1 Tax=Limnohabitans sp. TaxID=1907725 RepID=UPI0037BF01E9